MELKIEEGEVHTMAAGIVTVSEWLAAPDERTYLHFWAPEWLIVPEKGFIGRVRGNSGFFLVAGSLEEPLLIIPGCRFSSWAACRSRRSSPSVYYCEVQGQHDSTTQAIVEAAFRRNVEPWDLRGGDENP